MPACLPVEALACGVQVVGDDLLVTNSKRVQTAIEKKACNALLLKVRLHARCPMSGHVSARPAPAAGTGALRVHSADKLLALQCLLHIHIDTVGLCSAHAGSAIATGLVRSRLLGRGVGSRGRCAKSRLSMHAAAEASNQAW